VDIIITYDAVQTLLKNLPSLNPCPNIFNCHEQRSHSARALNPCPQSPGNGWAGAVMSPERYILIDPTPFHLSIAPTTLTPAYPIKYNPEGIMVPYTCKEKSTIDAKCIMVKKKNYFKTWKNIYCTCYDTLEAHVNNAFKVALPPNLPTTRWNGSMSLHDIFDQLTTTYGTSCAFLQESPEFPGIRRNLGSKNKELRSNFAGASRKSQTDHKGMLKNMFLFCQNVKIRPSRDL
jgi:hypothetical protein